jgi:hypothetical protein
MADIRRNSPVRIEISDEHEIRPSEGTCHRASFHCVLQLCRPRSPDPHPFIDGSTFGLGATEAFICSRYTHHSGSQVLPDLSLMSRQIPPSNSPPRSGSHGRDSYTGRSGHRIDQNASTSKAPSKQHRPLTAKLKSIGLSADSILYRIARKIDRLDLWSTNVGRRWENRHSGGRGDGRSYGRERRSGSVGVPDRQRQGQRNQNRASLGEGRRRSLQHGQERRVSSGKSKIRTGRHTSSRPRVTAVKPYVNDPDSRDTSNDSEAARFRRKMGIDTPPHTLSSSAQRSVERRQGNVPTSVVGLVRDATRPETTPALRPSIGTRATLVDPNGAKPTVARQSRNQTTSHRREQGQDRRETRGTVDDAELPRRRETKHDRREAFHTSVSPLLYGK